VIQLSALIKTISQSGLVTVIFNIPILLPGNLSMIDERVLHISVKPSPDSDPQVLNISSWFIQSKQSLRIILIFRFRDLAN
jgi:hypothetical protein